MMIVVSPIAAVKPPINIFRSITQVILDEKYFMVRRVEELKRVELLD
jgi:hypothetical protein